MENNNLIMSSLIAVVAAAGGYVLGSSGSKDTAPVAVVEDETVESSVPAVTNDTVAVRGEEEVTPKASGIYDTYSAEKLAEADGDVVLFFHSKSCASCKATEKDLMEKSGDIPEDLTILQLDFNDDSEENMEIRKKYGVTTYHTFVQVDSDGNQIDKWSGSRSLDDIESKVN